MKNYFYCLLSIIMFTTPGIFGQNSSGKVIYKQKVEFPEDRLKGLEENNPDKYQDALNFFKRIQQSYERFEYDLIFNETSSLFKPQELLNQQNQLIGVNDLSIYYLNHPSKSRLEKVERGGEEFMVSREPISWKITREIKEINGFTCRKAVAEQNFFSHRSNKNLVQHIEAWFAPEIPFPHGPNGFGGLPGLILNLKAAGAEYYAAEIDLNYSTKIISKPSKGKEVTFPEFQALMAGMSEKFKEFNNLE